MSLSSIPNTGVAITNPLVLYRALVATNRITQDPAQHRLGKQTSDTFCKLPVPMCFSNPFAKTVRSVERL